MQAQRLGSVAATRQGPPRHPVQRTYRGQRPDRLRPCLQARPRRHCLEAQGLCLPFRTLARLAQDEESGLLGGEEGGGRGLGALTAPGSAFSAASPKTSTSRSPTFASSMILLTIISSVRSAGRLTPR